MKTNAELIAWCGGAAAQFGDPSLAVERLFVRYRPLLDAPARTPGVCSECRCTETAACDPPCSWVNADSTWCSSCASKSDEAITATYAAADRELVIDILREQFELTVNVEGPVIVSGAIVEFEMERVVDGLWSLTPSLNIPEFLHVFVV
ncbi:MAG TPA: hypothetical protein VHU41_15900, partial [Thermoanaerobaculia bacterium]|nr:hypothetical protein [Thermoanaerobaculia bacterium]